MTIKTKDFNPDTDPKLLCTCGHTDCDKRSVRQSVLDRTQKGRDIINRALNTRSGGRCQHHPDEQHRTTPADHQKRNGIDLGCNGGLERGQLVKVGIEVGFNAIGVGKTFVHWGYRPELAPGDVVMWKY